MKTGYSTPPIFRSQPGAGGLSNADGVCLSELMISLAIGAGVLATGLTTLNIVQTHAGKQQHSLNQQQDLRLGLEVFEQEVRLATAGRIVTAGSREFQFYANLSDRRTVTIVGLLPGQSVLDVVDGSGWGEGKTISVCGRQACESHQLAHVGQRHQLTLAEPLESSFPEGASVQILNRVVYYVKRHEAGHWSLMRMVDGGASLLIGDLDDLQFTYWDDMGHRTDQPSLVTRVVLESQSDQPLHHMVREVSIRS